MKWFAILVGGALGWALGCDEAPRSLALRVGEPCFKPNDCQLGHCELAAAPDDVASESICCAVRCPDGTGCEPTGGFCVDACTGPGCQRVGLPLGEACVFDDDCSSRHCDVHPQDGPRCCEDDCTSRDQLCAPDGRCVPGALSSPLTRGTDDAVGAGGGADEPCSSCEPSTTVAVCGNQIVESGEECDGELSCTRECLRIECGDGRLDSGEECDPPNGDDCSATCRALSCGNNRLDSGEECEPPLIGSCNDACLLVECGNLRLDEGEECDPPQPGACDSSCLLIECGNGRIDAGEGCDPPVPGLCSDECRAVGCGNTVLDPGEECDPPEQGHCDGNCLEIECGNGRVDEGEECEPPNQGQCGDRCLLEQCGNGRQDPGEECEPPLQGNCSGECTLSVCGNHRLDPGEACDAGPDGDAECSRFCTLRDASAVEYLYTFDDGLEGWSVRLTSPSSLGSDTRLELSSAGEPEPGSLQLRGAFTGATQKVEIDAHENPVLNLERRILTARVRLLSGFVGAGKPGAVKMFAKSGPDYTYVSGDWVELTPGGPWLDVGVDPANPTLITGPFVMDDVREIGFEFATFAGAEQVTVGTFEVDSVGLIE